MHQTTPIGELQRALRKSAHLSNKKKNNKKRKLKKQNEHTLERLHTGDIISYQQPRAKNTQLPPAEVRYGIVIEVHGGKKKWLREYKILTEYSVWTLHTTQRYYIILKVE